MTCLYTSHLLGPHGKGKASAGTQMVLAWVCYENGSMRLRYCLSVREKVTNDHQLTLDGGFFGRGAQEW